MPSGKQTSFQYGEVSELQEFKSNDTEYSNALKKLYNMYVKRTGGVSNRAGTEYFNDIDNLGGLGEADNLSVFGSGLEFAEGEPIPIRTFHLRSSKVGDFFVTVIRDPAITIEPTFKAYISTWNDQLAASFVFNDPRLLEKLNVTYSKGWYVFTPSSDDLLLGTQPTRVIGIYEDALTTWNSSDAGATPLVEFSHNQAQFQELGSYSFTLSKVWVYNGPSSPVYFPVSYLWTFETQNGVETVVYLLETENINLETGAFPGTPANSIFYPASDITNFFTLDFTAGGGTPDGLARINLYRSVNMTGGFTSGLGDYKLVSRFIPIPGTLKVNFQDTGASVASVTPPIDGATQLNPFLAAPANVQQSMDYAPVQAACAAPYQERLIMGMYANNTLFGRPNLKPGDCLVSKLGTPSQFMRPLVLRDTEGFSFSVPDNKGSPVEHLLSDKRLAAFTEESVSIVAGGENGVISLTQINPVRISDEGANKYIVPKMAGNYGVFMNNILTKLMAVVFLSDGGVSVRELSKWSSHLINFDICQLETIRNADGEDQIFLLSRTGKIVCVTINEDGLAGFSEYEFPRGRVVSMFRGRRTRRYDERYSRVGESYDYLGLYVARNNYIQVERLSERVDDLGTNTTYSDCTIFFGARLSFNGAAGYKQIQVGTSLLNWWYPPTTLGKPDEVYVNITAQVANQWDAGDILIVEVSESLATRSADHISIQHYYEDSEGNLKSVILYPIWSTQSLGPPYTIQATCEISLPEELRDIDGMSIAQSEKNARSSRWLVATKEWSGALGNDVELLYQALDEDAYFDYGGTLDYIFQDGVKSVDIVADGLIISSPNDPQFPTKNLEAVSGTVEFEEDFEFPVSYGYVGIPYESEMVTLPIEAPDNRTLSDDKKLVNKVGLALYNTKEAYIGLPDKDVQNMEPLITNEEQDISASQGTFSGHVAPFIPSEWHEEGSISVKQVNPAPITVLAVYPKGISGE